MSVYDPFDVERRVSPMTFVSSTKILPRIVVLASHSMEDLVVNNVMVEFTSVPTRAMLRAYYDYCDNTPSETKAVRVPLCEYSSADYVPDTHSVSLLMPMSNLVLRLSAKTCGMIEDKWYATKRDPSFVIGRHVFCAILCYGAMQDTSRNENYLDLFVLDTLHPAPFIYCTSHPPP